MSNRIRDLAEAIRRESNQAVAHRWDIDPQTVSKWRRLLGVERATDGTSRLHSEYTKEPWAAVPRQAVTKAGIDEYIVGRERRSS
jgi:transposase-like protein